MGIYKLTQVQEEADDWILMIDESIEFGHDKLLVVLGIRESNIDFSRPLQYHDMTCLKLVASNSWKGEDIKDVLDSLTLQLGRIKYVVADMGNSIKKALKLTSMIHVVDITHKISWIIKELYEEDELFKSYCEKLAHLRGRLGLSDMSHILPPQQRINSRYMNLKPIFEWGMAVLRMLETETTKPLEREKMLFIKDYEGLIRQTHQLINIANRIQEILKNNGLSKEIKKECMNLFKNEKDGRILKFKVMIDSFLTSTYKSIQGSKRILCTSDILESSFGKYKNYISDNISVGITNLSLTIPAFSSKLDKEEIKTALETVKVNNIKEWSTSFIGHTQTIKRREALKMGGRKKCFTPYI